MSILQRIALVLAAAFSAILLAVLAIQFVQTRSFLVEQMEVNTRNTVASLGLSMVDDLAAMSVVADVTIDSKINAVFDSGLYQLIQVTRFSDGLNVRKERDDNAKVPTWFQMIIPMPQPAHSQVLTDGWMQTAEITVITSPNLAYEQMWQSSLQILFTTLFIAALIMLWVVWGMRRLLTPIRAVEEQSKRLQDQQVGAQIPEPNTRELKGLVVAFNQLSDRVSRQFAAQDKLVEQYRIKAFQDELTGYRNRAYLQQYLPLIINRLGALTIVGIRLGDASAPARPGNFRQFIRILEYTTRSIDTFTNDAELKARLSDYEFLIALPKLSDPDSLCKQLQEKLIAHQLTDDLSLLGKSIVVSFSVTSVRPIGELLTQLDQLFTRRESATERGSPRLTGSELNTWLKLQIERRSISLLKQPIYALAAEDVLHWEVFARPKLEELGLAISEFYSALSEFQLGRQWDRIVIASALEKISDFPLAINITPDTTFDDEFVGWLKESKVPAEKIVFELTESMVCQEQSQGFNMAMALKDAGFRIGIDRVGNAFASLNYLKMLRPAYAKFDPVFTQMAVTDEKNQMFIGSLANTVHSLGIPVIATRVELQDELALLEHFAIDAIQGYLHRPQPVQ